MSQKKNFYAVRVGRHPGIYRTWAECDRETKGHSGAVFKSFATQEEAEIFLYAESNVQDDISEHTISEDAAYAFVDGSFNPATGVYGYGGFLICNGIRYVLQGKGNSPEMASMRNISGEILGSTAAIEKAVELGIPELYIYYDYSGIELWATGDWKRNKFGTMAYYEYVQSVKDTIQLHFVKVKGHSGVEGNEEADQLAKEAVGIEEFERFRQEKLEALCTADHVVAVESPELSNQSQTRYVLIDEDTGEVLEDCNGYGFKSEEKTMASYRYQKSVAMKQNS
jgi:ribonuclease HI